MSHSQKNSYGIPLSLREWLVCIFATLTLVFTAWSLGAYKTWALHLLFAGGMGTFLASIFPMPKSWNGYDQQHGNLKNLKRLLLQPFFWPGLCFLVYILIQYFNPSVVQVFGEKSWWVERMTPPLGANLPSSVKADYETMNALRTFVIQASAISLACGILVGIQRRKSALVILWSFVISGVTMAFVAILQKLSGADKLLWVVNVQNENPWGTFAYRNQGAAFLILVFLITGLLYFFYARRSTIKMGQAGPHLLLFFFVVIIFYSIWLALSRGGIIFGTLLLIIFCALALVKKLKVISSINALFATVALLVVLITSFSFLISEFSDWEELNIRKADLQREVSNITNYSRFLSTKATFEMAKDNIVYGWGGGSFRYIFPIYQIKYDSLWYSPKYKQRPKEGRKIYNYAHNDWAQFLAEYGLVGCIFVLGMFFCLIWKLVKISLINLTAGFYSSFGIALIFIHNFLDFIFSCPAYWYAFWASLFLVFKLFYFEKRNK